jgi:hypothetical protein
MHDAARQPELGNDHVILGERACWEEGAGEGRGSRRKG